MPVNRLGADPKYCHLLIRVGDGQANKSDDAANDVRFGWASERAALLGSVSPLRVGA
jgi:hypothetical protein